MGGLGGHRTADRRGCRRSGLRPKERRGPGDRGDRVRQHAGRAPPLSTTQPACQAGDTERSLQGRREG
eukprot:2457552-Alexandrium_andersonii.AAC.1